MKTLKQWNKRGRWIKKGEKAKGFNKKGKPLFKKKQTRKIREEKWGGRHYDFGTSCEDQQERSITFAGDWLY